jgi:hypothetical protein
MGAPLQWACIRLWIKINIYDHRSNKKVVERRNGKDGIKI